MMKDVIEAGKNIVDISFYPEDPFGLDELKKGVVSYGLWSRLRNGEYYLWLS